MVSAYEEIRTSALALLEERRIDPSLDADGAEDASADAVSAYQQRSHVGGARPLNDPEDMKSRVVRSIVEFGPVTELFSRPDVEEIFFEGPAVRYIDGSGRLKTLTVPTTEEENRHVVTRLLSDTDRHLDTANPIVQARILNGTGRLSAVIPPVADQLSATIRRYSLRRQTLRALVELGSLDRTAADFLRLVSSSDSSLIVSGPPGAGKTSMLSALLDATPPTLCIRACEEVRELNVALVHGSYYEARPGSLDGSGEITLRALVKMILAMRPDRIVVGEVRGAEAFELTRAVNAGCGFSGTVHANSARDALSALVNAALMAGENVTESVVQRVFADCIDVVIHLTRRSLANGMILRQVEEIVAVVPSLGDGFSTEALFDRKEGGELRWTGVLPHPSFVDRLERDNPGISVANVLSGRETL